MDIFHFIKSDPPSDGRMFEGPLSGQQPGHVDQSRRLVSDITWSEDEEAAALNEGEGANTLLHDGFIRETHCNIW